MYQSPQAIGTNTYSAELSSVDVPGSESYVPVWTDTMTCEDIQMNIDLAVQLVALWAARFSQATRAIIPSRAKINNIAAIIKVLQDRKAMLQSKLLTCSNTQTTTQPGTPGTATVAPGSNNLLLFGGLALAAFFFYKKPKR